MCGSVPNNSQRSQASSLIMPSPEHDLDVTKNQEERYRSSNIMGE